MSPTLPRDGRGLVGSPGRSSHPVHRRSTRSGTDRFPHNTLHLVGMGCWHRRCSIHYSSTKIITVSFRIALRQLRVHSELRRRKGRLTTRRSSPHFPGHSGHFDHSVQAGHGHHIHGCHGTRRVDHLGNMSRCSGRSHHCSRRRGRRQLRRRRRHLLLDSPTFSCHFGLILSRSKVVLLYKRESCISGHCASSCQSSQQVGKRGEKKKKKRAETVRTKFNRPSGGRDSLMIAGLHGTVIGTRAKDLPDHRLIERD